MIKSDKDLTLAVVGCGAAGFYMTRNILKHTERVKIHIYDRNPHPFGLIRTGVAPDHQAMKRIQNDFTGIIQDPKYEGRVEFIGNTWVGQNGGVPIQDLRDNYSGIILTYGATSERTLGVPGEHTVNGVMHARQVTDWYNGSLDSQINIDKQFNLERIRDLAIVGNGNIAMDISRMLLKKPDQFADSDIPSSVLDKLRKSQIQNIHVIGRRGLVQSAFAMKELKEILTSVDDVELYILQDEVLASHNIESDKEVIQLIPRNRTDFVKKHANLIENHEHYQDIIHQNNPNRKKIILRYLKEPVEFVNDAQNQLSGVKLNPLKLIGKENNQKAVLDDSQPQELLQCQALIKSIGWKSLPMDGVPFNNKTNTIPHTFGCVRDMETGQTITGLYIAGWIKRGPNGIIDATLRDSMETFKMVKHHIENDMLPEKTPTYQEALDLAQKYQQNEPVLTFGQWQKVDSFERQQGKLLDKIREKVTNREQMLSISQN